MTDTLSQQHLPNICQLSYIGYIMLAGKLCQLLTAYAVPASATSDQTNWRIIKSKARHNIHCKSCSLSLCLKTISAVSEPFLKDDNPTGS